MRMARCSDEWHYNTAYGGAGLVLAALVLFLTRHDVAQGLTLAVVITSAAGWTRRRRSGPSSQGADHGA